MAQISFLIRLVKVKDIKLVTDTHLKQPQHTQRHTVRTDGTYKYGEASLL